MSLENILNEIDNTTQAELKAIRDEYSAKIEAIIKSCNDKISRIKNYYAVKSDNDVKNIIKQYEDNIRLQSKKIIDDKKKEILVNTMQKLRSYVTSLNKSSNYPELLKAMVNESKKELGNKFTVYCDEMEDEKLQGFQFPDSIKVIIDKSIKSGIIAVSADGKKEVDMRLSSIFDEISYDVETYLYENIK